ncbi:MAG: hypothetical protein QOH12_1667 [Solirubrobacteraceae bacterium]|nr:hypothetical protein [Solirubrobacteraceae bacterium]
MRSAWTRLHPVARIGGLIFAVIVAFGLIGFSGPLSGSRVAGWTSGGAGPRAAVVFVVLYAGLTMASLPGPVLAGAGGLLFGTLEGGLLALAGAVIGAVLAFTLARYVAGDLVERIGGRRVRGVADWVGRRGLRSMVLARAAPGMPFAAVSYAAGLTRVRLRTFALATGVVALPRTFAYAAVGGGLRRGESLPIVIAGFVILGMGVLGVALGVREGLREGAGRRWRRLGRSGLERPGPEGLGGTARSVP